MLGRHLLADFHGCPPALLSDAVAIEAALVTAARAAGATPLFARLHRFGEGQGVTGVVLLAESHLSIHTWPEHGFAAIDVFMCGACRPERAVAHLREALRPGEVRLCDQARGAFDPPPAARPMPRATG